MSSLGPSHYYPAHTAPGNLANLKVELSYAGRRMPDEVILAAVLLKCLYTFLSELRAQETGFCESGPTYLANVKTFPFLGDTRGIGGNRVLRS